MSASDVLHGRGDRRVRQPEGWTSHSVGSSGFGPAGGIALWRSTIQGASRRRLLLSNAPQPQASRGPGSCSHFPGPPWDISPFCQSDARCPRLLLLLLEIDKIGRVKACVSSGAKSGRPSRRYSEARGNRRVRVGLSTNFVSISDGLMLPGSFSRVKSFVLSLSCTHKSETAIWRTLPSPRRRQIPIAADASD